MLFLIIHQIIDETNLYSIQVIDYYANTTTTERTFSHNIYNYVPSKLWQEKLNTKSKDIFSTKNCLKFEIKNAFSVNETIMLSKRIWEENLKEYIQYLII